MPNLHAVVLSWSVQLEPLPSVRKVRWLLAAGCGFDRCYEESIAEEPIIPPTQN